jgi:hypothetical protein
MSWRDLVGFLLVGFQGAVSPHAPAHRPRVASRTLATCLSSQNFEALVVVTYTAPPQGAWTKMPDLISAKLRMASTPGSSVRLEKRTNPFVRTASRNLNA